MPAGARLFLALGALSALFAVVLGAFGAHGLRSRLAPEMLSVWHTAVQYHFWHALGMIAVGFAFFHLQDSTTLRAAGWLLLAGVFLFSGSLYALALTGERWLGAVAPLGGTAFIVGWGAFAWAVLRAG